MEGADGRSVLIRKPKTEVEMLRSLRVQMEAAQDVIDCEGMGKVGVVCVSRSVLSAWAFIAESVADRLERRGIT